MSSTFASVNVLHLLLLALTVVMATPDYNVSQAPPPGPPATAYTPSQPPVKTPNSSKPKPDIAIEGLILCNSDNKTYPIQGAKVKIACLIVDSYGKIVAKATIFSYPTDLKGYFYFVMYGLIHKVKNINSCRVKLESSPIRKCNTPTNVNKGVTGASLSSNSSKFLSQENLNIYTLEPFYFTPKPV